LKRELALKENPLKKIFAEGNIAVNGWLHIPSTWSAEVLANQGFDSLTVDLQHGLIDYQMAFYMMQAINTTDAIPLARVAWNDPAMIMKLLDAGAYGIICPMINSREECEAFVGACRYHPKGYRSLGPTRARFAYGMDYADHANDQILTIAMVETKEALDNLEEIVSTPGLDAIYIGPGDLGLSLGMEERVDNRSPEFLKIMDKVANECKAHNIVASIYTSDPNYAREIISHGFQFITVMGDTYMLAKMASQTIAAVRGEE
jgi:4-hydroxy-2-oxoheptanedioate aldolase